MFVLALFSAGAGVLQIAFPSKSRDLDRFLAESKGYQSHQGSAYEGRRVFGAVMLIVLGIVFLIIALNMG